MAQQLESFDFGASRSGSNGRPWDLWLNGKIWRLTSEDIGEGVKPSTFRGNCFTSAKKRGLKVKIRAEKDGSFVIQAYKDEPEAADEADVQQDEPKKGRKGRKQ